MRRKLELSVGQWLGLGFGTTLLLLTVQIGGGLLAFDRIGSLRNHLSGELEQRSQAGGDLERAVLESAVALHAYLSYRTPDLLSQLRRSQGRARAALSTLSALYSHQDSADGDFASGGQRNLRLIQHALDSYQQAARGLASEASRISKRRDLSQAEQQLEPLQGELLRAISALNDHQRQLLLQTQAAIEQTQRNLRLGSSLLAVLVLLCFAGTAALTIQGVRRPTAKLLAAVRAMQSGDYSSALRKVGPGESSRCAGGQEPAGPELPLLSPKELQQLSRAFTELAHTLDVRQRRIRDCARVSLALAGSQELERIAHDSLQELVAHTRADIGAIYDYEEQSGKLIRSATFGLQGDEARVLLPGEGIPGRAAESRTTIRVREVPPDCPLTIAAGAKRVPPRELIAAPIVSGDSLLGVLLLGSLHQLDDDEVDFVEHTIVHLGVSLHNARAQRRAELLAAQLRLRNEELQARNEELRLQREELRQQAAKEQRVAAELAEAHRHKDEFLAMLAHELRNPLAAISTASQLLLRSGGAVDGVVLGRMATIIQRQSIHLKRMVDDLLDLSRITHGRILLERQPVDMVGVVQQALETLRPRIEERRHRVELQLPEEPLMLEGDPVRLEQVVLNILDNAVRFTDPSGLISVAVRDDGGQLELSVEDDGVGIAPDLLPVVFDAFRQADRSLARTAGGLGIGLTLVRKLVELHEGSVHVESDGPNKGSRFTIRLPLLEASDRPGSSRGWTPFPGQPGVGAAKRPAQPAGDLRVLVVDDNPDVLEMLGELVCSWGYRAELASRGQQAIDMALKEPPDVLLLDIGLPDLDGFEVARTLRDKLPDRTRIVAVSGYCRDEDRQAALHAGFHRHLFKPLDHEVLRQLLASFDPLGKRTNGTVQATAVSCS